MVATPTSPRRDSGSVSSSDRAEPSRSGVTGSRCDRRFGGRLARIAGTVGLELVWNNWGPLDVN